MCTCLCHATVMVFCTRKRTSIELRLTNERHSTCKWHKIRLIDTRIYIDTHIKTHTYLHIYVHKTVNTCTYNIYAIEAAT